MAFSNWHDAVVVSSSPERAGLPRRSARFFSLGIAWETRPRPHRWCRTSRLDLVVLWPSRLVATAAENSQRWAFEAVATWLSANALGDITSATRQSIRLWSLAYDRASALLANRPIIWLPHIKTVIGIANYRMSSMPALGLGCCDRCHRLLFE